MDARTPSLLQFKRSIGVTNDQHATHLPPASSTSTWMLMSSVKQFATTLPAVPPTMVSDEFVPWVRGMGNVPPTTIQS